LFSGAYKTGGFVRSRQRLAFTAIRKTNALDALRGVPFFSGRDLLGELDGVMSILEVAF
jgi:hypothetical protein